MFEEHPWLLIPIVIAIVEAWTLTKGVVRRRFERNDIEEARDTQRRE
jgi:hypothetical protein